MKVGRFPERRWKEFKRLRLESLRHDPEAFGSSYEEEVALKEDVWRRRMHGTLIAEVDGVPVGMVSCVFNRRPKTKHVADIYGVFVSPGHRRKGLGRKLLDSAVEEARRRQGVVKLRLAVNPLNKPAVSLYRGAGFRAIGRAARELKVGGRYFDLVYMERMI